MNFSSKIVEEAVLKIAELPGIGRKSALRMVLYLLKDQHNFSDELVDGIAKLKDVKFCKKCYNLSDDDLCKICSSNKRNSKVLCVVENIRDIMAIEETGHFNGLYHVLGGVISPLDGVGPSDLQIDSFVKRLEQDEVEEVIMAISPTIEGDTTIYYISKQIPDKITVSTIARGVSFGGELEYADELTLGRSISGRIPYKTDSDG